jgi:hypothetical protein
MRVTRWLTFHSQIYDLSVTLSLSFSLSYAYTHTPAMQCINFLPGNILVLGSIGQLTVLSCDIPIIFIEEGPGALRKTWELIYYLTLASEAVFLPCGTGSQSFGGHTVHDTCPTDNLIKISHCPFFTGPAGCLRWGTVIEFSVTCKIHHLLC